MLQVFCLKFEHQPAEEFIKNLKWNSEGNKMFLQGNLQLVFDALYTVGAIDPVLKLDWEQVTREMENHPDQVLRACKTINECQADLDSLVKELHIMDVRSVQFVALEVAREFCEFQDRKELH